jgi:(E)-4-hydroxy-3-methylbut-2-enyl-diphosphate synthase
MVQAYRMLAAEQYKLGWDYPMHLGVTEAGYHLHIACRQ